MNVQVVVDSCIWMTIAAFFLLMDDVASSPPFSTSQTWVFPVAARTRNCHIKMEVWCKKLPLPSCKSTTSPLMHSPQCPTPDLPCPPEPKTNTVHQTYVPEKNTTWSRVQLQNIWASCLPRHTLLRATLKTPSKHSGNTPVAFESLPSLVLPNGTIFFILDKGSGGVGTWTPPRFDPRLR